MSVIAGAGYVGDFAPGAKVFVPFMTFGADGAPCTWSGLGFAVRPDGTATEVGFQSWFDQPAGPSPAVGRHHFLIDLAQDPTVYPPGDYAVVAYGDPLPGDVPVQGVTIGHFSIANRA